jgi:hypothetical protein
LHLARQQELVENEVGLLEVEDDIQLAYVAVVLVHLLHVAVDDFEGDELVVGRVAAGDEEERGISAIDNLGVCPCVSLAQCCRLPDPLTLILEEVAHAGAAREDELGDVFDDFGLVLGSERGEPFG